MDESFKIHRRSRKEQQKNKKQRNGGKTSEGERSELPVRGRDQYKDKKKQ